MKVEKMEIHIDETKCIRCGKCATVCPQRVLVQVGKEDSILISQEEMVCIQCGHCVDVCPQEAIHHESFPNEKIHLVDKSLLPSPDSLMELMRSRRSNRTITSRPIPSDAMDKILEAARYAPTAENSRLVQWHLITDASLIQAVEDSTMRLFTRLAKVMLHPLIKPILRPFLEDLYAESPALLAMEKEWKKGLRPATCNVVALLAFTAPEKYDFGWQDCNLSYQNASLMAETLGVSQVYMGFVATAFKIRGTKQTARLLRIPKNQKVYALMGLGIPAFTYPCYVER